MSGFTLTTESDGSGIDQPDQPSIDDGGLNDNVVEDIVHYTRGNVIRNEKQGFLLLSSWVTGWMGKEDHYNNIVVVGSPSGGKSHLTQQMKKLLPEKRVYDVDETSRAAIYNDHDNWSDTYVAIFGEFQKLNKEVREVIKAIASDDGGSTRQISHQDEESGDWDGADRQSLESKPYSFQYAEYEIEEQQKSRMFRCYIGEDRQINEAVSRQHSEHTNISVGDDDVDYIYDVGDVEGQLKDYIKTLPSDFNPIYPEWIYYAYNEMLGLDRGQSKRNSAMIPAFIRSSCLLNYQNRRMDVDGEKRYVVQPQDVANVLSCRDILIGTTHGVEQRKMALVDAIKGMTKYSDYCTIEDIQEYLVSNPVEGVSRMKKSAMEELLNELEEMFVVRSQQDINKDGETGYKFLSLNQIGYPRTSGFQQFEYQSDEPFLGVEDPSNVWDGCSDPFRDIPFVDSVEKMREEDAQAISATGGGSGSSSDGTTDAMSASEDDPSQQTFGVSETPELDDPITIAVHERLTEVADGEQFDLNGLTHEGVLSINTTDSEALAGTIADPEHDVWQYQDGSQKVHSIDEAKAKIEDSYAQLDSDDLLRWEAIDSDTAMCNVKDVEYDQ